jgi:hypothetical protein
MLPTLLLDCALLPRLLLSPVDISFDLTGAKFPTMQNKATEGNTHLTANLTQVSIISKQFLMDAIATEIIIISRKPQLATIKWISKWTTWMTKILP